MKKLVTFVSALRIPTLLCCSATVLLTACGGGTPETGLEPGAPSEPRLLASVDTGQPGATITAPDTEAASAPAPADAEAESASVPPAAPVDTPVTETDAMATLADGTAAGSMSATDTEPAYARAPSTYHLYVSPNGSDSNAGTMQSPFRTLGRAVKSVKPSTTVHVAPGTYRENVSTTVHGTAAGRIRYVSDVKWGAKLIGTGKEAQWDNKGNYTDISGFDISGSGRQGIVNWGSYTLVSGNHIHDIKVSGGCNGSGGAGVVNANYSGSDGEIIGNVVHDIGVPGKCNGVQGIYSSNKRAKIMNNIVYRVSSYGIHLWHAATDTIIANNTVFANGSNKMGGGIVTGVGDSPGGVVLNNTHVINNIVYKNPAAGIKQYCYSGKSCIGSTNTTANNLVYGNGSAISLRVGSATGTVSADPQFLQYNPAGTGDYRLKSGSPGVNRGTANRAPSYDRVGVQRPLGGQHDIGAYESY